MTLALLLFVTALHGNAAEPSMTDPYTNLAAGPSVPAADANFGITSISPKLTFPKAVSRKTGGEYFEVTREDGNQKKLPLDLTAVRVIAYSKSGKGGLLVRNAEGDLDLGGGNYQKISINPLMIFAQRSSQSHATEKDGHVFLSNGDFVRFDADSGQSLKNIRVQLEAFGDDDASVVVQAQQKPSQSKVKDYIAFTRQLVNASSGGSGGGSGRSSGGSDGTCQAACAANALSQYMQCSQQPGADAAYCQRASYGPYGADCGCQ